MGALLRFCRDFKWHPLALDHGLALTLLALNLIVPGSRHVGERIQLTPTVVVLTVVAAVALALRRLAPLVVLAVTTAVTITYLIVEQGKSPIVLFMACAVYTVVMEKDRRTRSIAVAVVALLTLVADAPVSDGNVLDNLGLMFLVLFAGAVAEAVRYRRALQQELEERALRAEQSREEEAQRRVIEERLRIAHELHDVIAHHIALMNVQSGVAAHVLRTQPEEAERALALVRSGGRTVLQELTVLLGVLRRSGSSLPTTPTPSLHELGALIASFTAAGVEVDWHLPDSLGDLPDVIELTAYRIVQESLTNVLKHAPGATAHLQLSRHPGTLTIDITNTAPPTSTRAKPLAPALTSASQPSAAGTLRHGEPRPSTIPKPHPNGAHPGPATSTPNADTATSAPRPGTSTPQPHDVHPGTSTSTPHPSDARPRPATSRSHPNEARPGAATSTPHPNDARPSATPGPTPGTPPPTPWADGGGPHPIAGSPAPQPAGPSLDSAGISTPHAGEATTSSPPRPNGAAPTANPARLGAGHGLVGMWERVTAVGGELRTGPEPGGGFGIHAVLPLETGDVSDDPGLAGRRPDADSQRVPGAGELSTRSGGRC